MTAKIKPLSQQHRRFIAAYRRLRHATNAYGEVYPRSSQNTRDSEGPRLLNDPRIAQEIVSLDSAALKAKHMGADETLAMMAEIARVDPLDLCWKPGELDAAGMPTEVGTIKALYLMPPEIRRAIKSIRFDIAGRPEFVFHSKDAQLTNIAKHHKLLADNVNVNITLGFSERLRAAREKRLGAK